MTRTAKLHFGLKDHPSMKIIHQDARAYLKRSDKRYGAILLDVFSSSPSIPFHLTTREFAELINEDLSKDGVLITNCISALEGKASIFLASLINTYKMVFPHVLILPMKHNASTDTVQNIIVVALKNKTARPEISDISAYKELLDLTYNGPLGPSELVLTDSYAPVESLALPILDAMRRSHSNSLMR
jgi:spermidine synthase